MDRYHAACCQLDMPNPKTRDEMPGRVKRMLDMMEFAVVGYRPFHDVKLVVFPEFAHAAPIYPTVDKLIERLAVELPNEHTRAYQRKAAELGCFVQTGTFLEVDPRYPGHVFNTTCLIGPDRGQGDDGLLFRYRKTHPWIPWEVHSSPHDVPGYAQEMFPVADTEIGKIGAAICYDWLFPEAIRQLALNGAEVLVRVSAYMDPWGASQPMDWWTLINRTRAIENLAAVVACNQGASLSAYPPFSWPGGSMIVDLDGRVMSQANPGPGEQIIVGPVDLAGLRAERRRRAGHDMPAHLRVEAYRGYHAPRYPAGAVTNAVAQPLSVEANDERIAAAKRSLRG